MLRLSAVRRWRGRIGGQMAEAWVADGGTVQGAGPPKESVVKRLLRRRGVEHIVRAVERFNARLGLQFAAAITYFSFLAVVPLLMVGFSIAGFVLKAHPQTLVNLEASIAAEIPGRLSIQVAPLLENAIDTRLTVGIIGLVVALYSGVSWMGNVRSAIQAQWRPDFDDNQEIAAESLPRYYWKSLRYLVVFGVAVSVSLALTTIGSTAQGLVLRWLGLDRITALTPVFTVGPLLLAFIADTLIFLGIYTVLPPNSYPPSRKALIRGSAMAGAAFEILKLGLTVLFPALLSSVSAKVFGPIIGLLFFFDFVATVVLFVAAWIATAVPQPVSVLSTGVANAGALVDPESVEPAGQRRSHQRGAGRGAPPSGPLLFGLGAIFGWLARGRRGR